MENASHGYHVGDRFHEALKAEAARQGIEISALLRLIGWDGLRRLQRGEITLSDLVAEQSSVGSNRITETPTNYAIDTAEKQVYTAESTQKRTIADTAGGHGQAGEMFGFLGKLFSPKDAAKELGISERAAQKAIKTGRLKARRVGHGWVILEEDLNAAKQQKWGK